MGKREFGEEEVIDVQEEAVDTSDVSADNMISAKELEAREKKEARKKEWADNKIMLRERKGEMYEVLLANGFDQEYCDGLQKIIGETYVKKARTKRVPRLAQRDQFVALFNDEDGNGIIGKVVKGMDIFTDATSALGGIGKDKLNILCADAIRKATEPALRYWISATPDEAFPMVNNYELLAIGEEAPEGWEGFMPSETL